MSFWQLAASGDAPALLGAAPAEVLSYAELAAAADAFTARLGSRTGKRLGLLLCCNDSASVAAYLGALRAHDCVALLPERLDDLALADLIERYRPDWVLLPPGYPLHHLPQAALAAWRGKVILRYPPASGSVHPDTALLLSTSGSTGSPKMVRLSFGNLASNANAIAEYLGITAAERPITTLPIHYSYGLSILNSHLARGAAIVVSNDTVTARPFWDLCRSAQVSSLAGVPTTWQMLQRLRLERMDLPHLRTLTQAGGRLAPDIIEHFAHHAAARGWRFFVMYGQTEASPRIAYVPPERLLDKIGAIGIAIPGGELSLSEAGELLYRGTNVMQGYAECRADLARGDELGGLLHTGDLARVDDDGYYWLTGRIKRIAKVFGNRVNLDEIEALLEAQLHCSVAALDEDDALRVFLTDATLIEAAREILRKQLAAHPSGIRLQHIAALPLTPNGKKDYPTLRGQIAHP